MLRPDQSAILKALESVENIINRSMEGEASPQERMKLALTEISELNASRSSDLLPSTLKAKIEVLAAKLKGQLSASDTAKASDFTNLLFDLFRAFRQRKSEDLSDPD